MRALAGVDLEVPQGAHVALIGPSGSGKSSLVAVLAGQIAPSAGRVEIGGRVARIHQDLRLVPRASALRNVLHGCLGRVSLAQSLRFPPAERARAEALLRRVGLGHRLHAPVRTLSGGEAQRVAIARALMQDPDILLADEPVASLDPANAAAIMALLDELRRERGLTLVSVLHDLALAERCADRIVRLQSGHVMSTDPGSPAPPSPPAPVESLPPRLPPSVTFLALVGVAVALSWGVMQAAPGAFDGAAGEALRFLARLVPKGAQWAEIPWEALSRSLVDTLRMAILGTVMASVIALPLSALAARNIAPPWIGWPVRAALNLWRAVPSIVWALLFVAAVGLGAIAGVLGLIAYSVGYLTKFFYEAFEGAETSAAGALAELGASGPKRFVHAVWPVALPALAGAILFMLEYNVRAASVLGIVGAGGIGHDLKLAVDWSNWHVVGAILALLALAVLAVDSFSAWARARIG
ncbi:phosphonate ABC transporter, permease protein PhnE [Thermaurantiacus sp.]